MLHERIGDFIDVACAHGHNAVARSNFTQLFFNRIKIKCDCLSTSRPDAFREYLARDGTIIDFTRGVDRSNKNFVGATEGNREIIKQVARATVEMRMKCDEYLTFHFCAKRFERETHRRWVIDRKSTRLN